MAFDKGMIEYQFEKMMEAQERMRLGRSLFFKDTPCYCRTSLLCSDCSLEGREKMTEIFKQDPMCSYCRGIDVYMDFVEEYKDVLLASRDYGIEDDERWLKNYILRKSSRSSTN